VIDEDAHDNGPFVEKTTMSLDVLHLQVHECQMKSWKMEDKKHRIRKLFLH